MLLDGSLGDRIVCLTLVRKYILTFSAYAYGSENRSLRFTAYCGILEATRADLILFNHIYF